MVAQQKKLENRLMPTEIIDYEIGEKFTNPETGEYDSEVVDKGKIKKPKSSYDVIARLKDKITKYLNKGEKEYREYAITLCKDGRFYVVKGQKGYSRIVRCIRDPDDAGIFAVVHNHPSGDEEPSYADITAMYDTKSLMCVASKPDLDIELGRADVIRCVKPIKRLLKFKELVSELISSIVSEAQKATGSMVPTILALKKFARPELKLSFIRDDKKEEEQIVEEVLEGVSKYIESKSLKTSEYILNKLIMSLELAEEVEE